MRLVLDTNVLISALGWNGKERAVLLETLSNNIDLLLSEDIINEFLHVLSYDKFTHLSIEKISLFLEIIMETSIIIDTKTKLSVIKEDPDDNKILECAVDGKADYIISGDKHLLKLEVFEGIKILKANDFLNLLQ